MGKKANMIRINGEKLRLALELRNLKVSEVSKGMGYNAAYINNAIERGTIAPAGAKALELGYNIPLEEYEFKYDEPLPWDIEDLKYEIAPEEPKTINVNVHLDDAQLELFLIDLKNIIHSEVKRAWQEV